MATPPTARFTDRVAAYVKARPGYPADLISLLERRCGLTADSTVVDVGCGTGLLAKLFCDFGCRVVGVEPNAAMRAAGEAFLRQYTNFKMLEGQAEGIPLHGTTVDFISAGQAFHWFDLDRARHEFMRILKPNGWAVLVWNDREITGSKFAEAYEDLVVRFGIDYADVRQLGRSTSESLERFFGYRDFCRDSFPNVQQLDHDAFVSRVKSASYMPAEGTSAHPEMLRELERIFRENQVSGTVTMKYTTNVIYGQMT